MFFGHCAAQMFQDWEPQRIECPEVVANRLRLTEKQMARAIQVVDGNVGEVDWDVGVSSHPVVRTKKFGCWTGRGERVETREGDDVFYARVERKGDPIWGRFVRGRKGEMARSQTVILRPYCDAGPVGWLVVAAYVGEPAPAFPGDPYMTGKSREYWSRHALLDGAIPYSPGTETTQCPWKEVK